MNQLIAICINSLGLKCPYEIILKPKMKNAATYRAHYSREVLKKHVIRININNLQYDRRSINELIAHEFIHAWQEENNVDDIHGKPFQSMAEILQEELNFQGFDIDNLYIADIDN